MKVAMVKHKPYGKVFWFEIPEHLVGKLQPGFHVACNTARGRRYGTVVAADLDEQDVKEVIYDITTSYDDYSVYDKFEQPLLDLGWDVIVFVPSKEEDSDRITCGNALISEV